MKRLLVLLLIAAGLLVSRSSFAQCPDASGPAPDPATCPWNSHTLPHQPIIGTGCSMTVHYCERCCGGVIQIYLTGVDLESGCTPPDFVAVIYQARDYAFNAGLNDEIGNIAPCDGLLGVQVTTYVPGCFTYIDDAVPAQINGCSPYGGCVCQRTCHVCKQKQPDGSYIFETDGCFNSGATGCDCVSIPVGQPWMGHSCYFVPCQEN